MNKCQKCKGTNNLNGNSISTKGVIHYLCKDCNTKRFRKYRKTKNGIKKTRDAIYKSIDKHKNKQNARALVHYHVTVGNLCRPNKCEECNKKTKPQAHHEDYSKLLVVNWLCRQCHDLRHI
jgi:hypothetical protein